MAEGNAEKHAMPGLTCEDKILNMPVSRDTTFDGKPMATATPKEGDWLKHEGADHEEFGEEESSAAEEQQGTSDTRHLNPEADVNDRTCLTAFSSKEDDAVRMAARSKFDPTVEDPSFYPSGSASNMPEEDHLQQDCQHSFGQSQLDSAFELRVDDRPIVDDAEMMNLVEPEVEGNVEPDSLMFSAGIGFVTASGAGLGFDSDPKACQTDSSSDFPCAFVGGSQGQSGPGEYFGGAQRIPAAREIQDRFDKFLHQGNTFFQIVMDRVSELEQDIEFKKLEIKDLRVQVDRLKEENLELKKVKIAGMAADVRNLQERLTQAVAKMTEYKQKYEQSLQSENCSDNSGCVDQQSGCEQELGALPISRGLFSIEEETLTPQDLTQELSELKLSLGMEEELSDNRDESEHQLVMAEHLQVLAALLDGQPMDMLTAELTRLTNGPDLSANGRLGDTTSEETVASWLELAGGTATLDVLVQAMCAASLAAVAEKFCSEFGCHDLLPDDGQ